LFIFARYKCKKLRVNLIIGGFSAEREVSLSSGRSILKALRELGHNVKVTDPIFGDTEVSEEEIFKDRISKEHPSFEKLQELYEKSHRNILNCINSRLFDDTDIAFIGLHGKFGEDGRIQSLLDIRGIKYTGSGFLSSALTLDKDVSKMLFRQGGILTPDWFSIRKNENTDLQNTAKLIDEKLGLPVVIKPNDEGSTVGLTIMNDLSDNSLKNSLENAFHYSDKIVLEKYIKGKEITVPVIGDEPYPVIEIKPIDGFYDYEHKYTKGMTEYFCPAELPESVVNLTMDEALKAHRILECSVYSRVDFILSEDNLPYCLEVNTLPGMTETSLVPKSAKAAGMDFKTLVQTIINFSINKNQHNG